MISPGTPPQTQRRVTPAARPVPAKLQQYHDLVQLSKQRPLSIEEKQTLGALRRIFERDTFNEHTLLVGTHISGHIPLATAS